MTGLLKVCSLLLLFFSIAQPAILVPVLGEYRFFFILASFSTVLFFIYKISNNLSLHLKQNKFIIGILFTYTLSEAQYMWFSGTLDVFLFWFKKVILYFIIIYMASEVASIKKLVWAVVLSAIILSFYGWDMYLHTPELLENAGRLQSVGNYNLSNSFALLLAVATPMAFCLMEIEKSFFKKLILFSALVLFLISGVYTKSRGGCMGIMAGFGLSIFYSRRIIKKKVMKSILIGVLCTLFAVYAVTIILTRTDISGYAGNDSSAEDRILCWKIAVRMAIDHPILGIGWGKYVENVRAYGLDKRLIAHNTPLSVLAETGFFGFYFYMSILFLTLKQLWKMRKYWEQYDDKIKSYFLAQGVLFSLICFLINTTFSVKDHDPCYWAILSIAGGLCIIYQNDIRRDEIVQ